MSASDDEWAAPSPDMLYVRTCARDCASPAGRAGASGWDASIGIGISSSFRALSSFPRTIAIDEGQAAAR